MLFKNTLQIDFLGKGRRCSWFSCNDFILGEQIFCKIFLLQRSYPMINLKDAELCNSVQADLFDVVKGNIKLAVLWVR